MYKSRVHVYPEPPFHYCLEQAKDCFGDDDLALHDVFIYFLMVGISVCWAHEHVTIKECVGTYYTYGLSPNNTQKRTNTFSHRSIPYALQKFFLIVSSVILSFPTQLNNYGISN